MSVRYCRMAPCVGKPKEGALHRQMTGVRGAGGGGLGGGAEEKRVEAVPGLAGGSLFGVLSGSRFQRFMQLVQRADRGGDHLRRNVGIESGGVDFGMAQQRLNGAKVGAVLQQVSAAKWYTCDGLCARRETGSRRD